MSSCNIPSSSGFSAGRWPREETLTLLEIRRRLHDKFNVPNSQRAPLWDEVSWIMSEEHGYERSGKKCKEKLDNLCKYYKKTKVAADKSSQINGKKYRFFRQLEALYGGENINTTTSCGQNQEPDDDQEEDLLMSCSDDEVMMMRSLLRMQVRRVMEVEEAWMERMLEVVERMEEERIVREAAWPRMEEERREREERAWECERAWIQARHALLLQELDREYSYSTSVAAMAVTMTILAISFGSVRIGCRWRCRVAD